VEAGTTFFHDIHFMFAHPIWNLSKVEVSLTRRLMRGAGTLS
jgi:hypothetical protein